MSTDVVDLREFYINPLGRSVRRRLCSRLRKIWPDLHGETLLSLGYGTPLLRQWQGEASMIMAMMPAEQGVVYWPREGPNISCLADISELPLADESADRIILMHALEAATDADALLREVWRVLKPDGKALFIVPNRRGLWAHIDSTPFGTGRPYSSFQLKDALRDQGFLVDRSLQALYMPPSQSRIALALAEKVEKYASWLFSSFGGLLIMEATKQIYAPILTKSRVFRHHLVLPLPFPVPTARKI